MLLDTVSAKWIKNIITQWILTCFNSLKVGLKSKRKKFDL